MKTNNTNYKQNCECKMSTRSGKRIHKSLHENMTNETVEVEATGDRKTRNRRLKADCDQLSVSPPKQKKRVNYVSYPSTDDDHSGDAARDGEPRPLRKHALKEITVQIEPLTNGTAEALHCETKSKPTRLTRRTKKFADEELPSSQGEVETEYKKAKKNKKKKKISIDAQEENSNEKENVEVEVPQKRTGKKKKNKKKFSSEAKVPSPEKKVNSMNNSATSVDSFHSAAGSPVKPSQPEQLNETLDRSGSRRSSRNTKDLAEDVLQVSETLAFKSPRRSSLKKTSITKEASLNGTFDKPESEDVDNIMKNIIPNPRRSSLKRTSIAKETPLNGTFEKQESDNAEKNISIRKSSLKRNSVVAVKDTTFDKSDAATPSKENTTQEKPLNSLNAQETKPETSRSKRHSIAALDTTFDKDSDTKLNSTFDEKSVSNDIVNLTFDKSDENISRISINSDDSKSCENILNTTPVLVESSMETSQTPETTERATRSASLTSTTPLKREGTFTKESPKLRMSPKTEKTPVKRQMSMPSPGRTPYLSNSKAQNTRQRALNLTHSLEKSGRKLSLAEPRMTRVMFCSPGATPVVDTSRKSKIIKSSMKGSNKTFVFQDAGVVSSGRKRSLAETEAEAEATPGPKRKRLADELRHSVDRLSRPRTPSATKPEGPTPKASATKSEVKRAKLPNFAALHKKQFARMESLGDCQKRRAARAQRLLAPSAPLVVLQRASPRGTATDPPKSTTKDINIDKKKDTPSKTKTELVKPGYTRFGFKLNLDVNPFSIPSETSNPPVTKEAKPMEKRPNGLRRQPTCPSLAGATGARKEEARQALQREKSASALRLRRDGERSENRTIIKGVRTNRRFELQMRSRNI